MTEYKNIMIHWCQEMLTTYNDSLTSLRDSHNITQLEEWKKHLLDFQEELSTEILVEPIKIYERANQLYLQFESYYTLNELPVTDTRLPQHTNTVPIGEHSLPPLPYNYEALEPYIDRETMRLHHDKHHKTYVDGLNKAEKEMRKARNSNDYSMIKHWQREAAFHGAGHYLHTIFWNIMTPDGGGEPTGMLMKEIISTFGSFEKFKQHFTEAAVNVEAVGWAILVWSPRSRRLEILQAEKHQNLSQWDIVPLLVLDVWEHAYYLKYKNDRKSYVKNWWNVVNWREVERRYHEGQQLKWKPF
ncbi:superoxide dismutase [Metabacillus malikii]|uniref:superoxide dismutase n=1 Tax=Metabacillus malikii TaxID=1504265 RepID=A0ABT9ZAR4_9BACI|nr:superoxide dismutase [Metabacillus malikii]MDQ0228921.1 Fe-Mn family superoxide dismutase [Metabacillus malikii]